MRVTDKALGRDEGRVLETIFWAGSPSRHALTDITGFSKSKLNAIVSDLIAQGWLEEGEPQGSSGGRPPNTVALSSQLGHVIGIDLGATSLDVTLSDPALNLVAHRRCTLDVREGPGAVMPMVSRFIAELLIERSLEPVDILGIGFGVPSPVAFESGMLVTPILMGRWDGFSFRDYFASSTEVPVVVDNDANVMALGELWHTRTTAPIPQPHTENFIVVKLGTGIGAGILARGELYRGADGAAGDVGHICADPSGSRCNCGNFGCLELYAGAPAIVRFATEAGMNGLSPAFARLLETNATLTTFDVGRAAQDGDATANTIIQEAGSRIGQVLAGMVNFFNPSRILIGGGIALIGPLMLASIRQSIYARSLPLSTRSLRIDHTKLGETSGVRGAAALALLHVIRDRTEG